MVALPTRLSPNFTLNEFLFSQTASRRGITNIPNATEVENMKALCVNVLEPLRAHFGKPMKTSSGFRCAKLCLAIGSKTTSQHARGEAWDGEIPGISNYEVAKWLVSSKLPFDQLILEEHTPSDPNSGWIHISHKAKGPNRRMYGFMKRGAYTWGRLK